jgi:hypothetical protein
MKNGRPRESRTCRRRQGLGLIPVRNPSPNRGQDQGREIRETNRRAFDLRLTMALGPAELVPRTPSH